MSKLEEALAQQLDLMGRDERWPWPAPVREFHPMWCCEHAKVKHHNLLCAGCAVLDVAAQPGFGRVVWRIAKHEYDRERNWRVDFAWPAQRVIVECEGIRYDSQGGRHQTGAGFARDLDKYTALTLAGWNVIRVGQRQITSGEALRMIEQALMDDGHPVAGWITERTEAE